MQRFDCDLLQGRRGANGGNGCVCAGRKWSGHLNGEFHIPMRKNGLRLGKINLKFYSIWPLPWQILSRWPRLLWLGLRVFLFAIEIRLCASSKQSHLEQKMEIIEIEANSTAAINY